MLHHCHCQTATSDGYVYQLVLLEASRLPQRQCQVLTLENGWLWYIGLVSSQLLHKIMKLKLFVYVIRLDQPVGQQPKIQSGNGAWLPVIGFTINARTCSICPLSLLGRTTYYQVTDACVKSPALFGIQLAHLFVFIYCDEPICWLSQGGQVKILSKSSLAV